MIQNDFGLFQHYDVAIWNIDETIKNVYQIYLTG